MHRHLFRTFSTFLLVGAISAGAACGGDDSPSGDGPDAGPDAPTAICGTAAASITAGGTFDGNVTGAGNDNTVDITTCAEHGQTDFGSSGEDQVVEVTGLTPGGHYSVTVDSDDDLALYVVTACTAGVPDTGACLIDVDATSAGETGVFDAPASGSVAVVIDTPDDTPPDSGAYTVAVAEVECVEATEATDCADPNKPHCVDNKCVECVENSECTDAGAPHCVLNQCSECGETLVDCTDPDHPFCGDDLTCQAGPDQCTGDDGREPNDGPAQAASVTAPTVGNPTTINASLCSMPQGEQDWYTFTLASSQLISVSETWATNDHDFDLYLLDDTGAIIGRSENFDQEPEAIVQQLDAGKYYIVSLQFAPATTAAASPYVITLAIADCQNVFDCENAAAPFCNAAGLCTTGPSDCVGDTAEDSGTTDDGPAAGRAFASNGGSFTGSVCSSPANLEADWFRFTAAAGEGFDFAVAFDGAAGVNDLDVQVFDADGKVFAESFWQNPETVSVRILPAGTYAIRVTRFSEDPETTSVPYTATLTKIAAQTCSTAADCDNAFDTQYFRGNCENSVCKFIQGNGAIADGVLCDSSDDCDSGICSYLEHQSNGAESVCTIECDNDGDCSGLAGTKCFTDFGICAPACDDDTECGADENSPTPDSGHAFDFFACNTTTHVCAAP